MEEAHRLLLELRSDVFIKALFSCAEGTPTHTKCKYRNMYLEGQLGEEHQRAEKQYAKSILLKSTKDRLKKEAQKKEKEAFERLEQEEREKFFSYYSHLKKGGA